MKNIFLLLPALILFGFSLSHATDKQYFFVFLNTNPDREELSEDKVMELQEGHMNNINRLAKEGKLLIAGPVQGGGGIFVLIAPSLKEANEYLQTDPAIKADRFRLEVYPMNIAEGNLCKVPEEDFKMISYALVRYEGNVSVSDKSILLVQIEFEGIDDGVVVLNYDLENKNKEYLDLYFTADKNIYVKTLWIGKGSFCE
jgi:uncharacterized protein YciI